MIKRLGFAIAVVFGAYLFIGGAMSLINKKKGIVIKSEIVQSCEDIGKKSLEKRINGIPLSTVIEIEKPFHGSDYGVMVSLVVPSVYSFDYSVPKFDKTEMIEKYCKDIEQKIQNEKDKK